MADDGHVLRPVASPESGKVFAEDHVQHPVQSVLHPPMGAHDACEAQGTEVRHGASFDEAPYESHFQPRRKLPRYSSECPAVLLSLRAERSNPHRVTLNDGDCRARPWAQPEGR